MYAISSLNLLSGFSFQTPKIKMSLPSVCDSRSGLQVLAQSPSLHPVRVYKSSMGTLGKRPCAHYKLQLLLPGRWSQDMCNSQIARHSSGAAHCVLLFISSIFETVFCCSCCCFLTACHFGHIQVHITRC